MKNKTTEKLITEYLMLDKNQKVPLSLSLKMFFNKKCHTTIKMIASAENLTKQPLNLTSPFTDSSIAAVMNKIAPQEYQKLIQTPISIANWIISGIFMIILLFSPLFLTNIMNSLSSQFSLFYSLFIATCVTAYASVFVFSNIDFFVKKISTKINLI